MSRRVVFTHVLTLNMTSLTLALTSLRATGGITQAAGNNLFLSGYPYLTLTPITLGRDSPSPLWPGSNRNHTYLIPI
eukprot:813147-Amorphochlora_amoeboformis.AAC.1